MPSPGQRVGEYVLAECIGRGTFGEVWRAHYNAWTDQIVADSRTPTSFKPSTSIRSPIPPTW